MSERWRSHIRAALAPRSCLLMNSTAWKHAKESPGHYLFVTIMTPYLHAEIDANCDEHVLLGDYFCSGPAKANKLAAELRCHFKS